MVSLEDALAGCERILEDEFTDYPESALYMIGTVEEAVEAREERDRERREEKSAEMNTG
jgi:F-type H+-transporting ATPase subunit beta